MRIFKILLAFTLVILFVLPLDLGMPYINMRSLFALIGIVCLIFSSESRQDIINGRMQKPLIAWFVADIVGMLVLGASAKDILISILMGLFAFFGYIATWKFFTRRKIDCQHTFFEAPFFSTLMIILVTFIGRITGWMEASYMDSGIMVSMAAVACGIYYRLWPRTMLIAFAIFLVMAIGMSLWTLVGLAIAIVIAILQKQQWIYTVTFALPAIVFIIIVWFAGQSDPGTLSINELTAYSPLLLIYCFVANKYEQLKMF